MSQLDLLTDEDLQTRQSNKWINLWLITEDARCDRCKTDLIVGSVVQDCCEGPYETMEEACASAKATIDKMIAEVGYEFVDWLGPVELP